MYICGISSNLVDDLASGSDLVWKDTHTGSPRTKAGGKTCSQSTYQSSGSCPDWNVTGFPLSVISPGVPSAVETATRWNRPPSTGDGRLTSG